MLMTQQITNQNTGLFLAAVQRQTYNKTFQQTENKRQDRNLDYTKNRKMNLSNWWFNNKKNKHHLYKTTIPLIVLNPWIYTGCKEKLEYISFPIVIGDGSKILSAWLSKNVSNQIKTILHQRWWNLRKVMSNFNNHPVQRKFYYEYCMKTPKKLSIESCQNSNLKTTKYRVINRYKKQNIKNPIKSDRHLEWSNNFNVEIVGHVKNLNTGIKFTYGTKILISRSLIVQ